MNSLRPTDLNEFPASVRHPTFRFYIMETVVAYQSGIYRAAIISTWIAVSYNIIAKLRELVGLCP
jgi:hypothetical protein